MKVLVSAASKLGATNEIAERIGSVLAEAGHEVRVVPPEVIESVAEFDVVILGSAVRIGHWLEPARRLAREHAGQLSTRLVWLFSSGPIGEPPKPEGDPLDVVELLRLTRARGHRVFAGKLDRSDLGLAERAMMAAVRAPEGDFRPWDEIDAWALEIARDLEAGALVTV